MVRRVPDLLYEEVGALVAAIAQPEAGASASFDHLAASDAYRRLIDLYTRRENDGNPDPFLTEALADMTDDSLEAVRLYRLALVQCSDFPGEPLVTKRIGLARRPLAAGMRAEALAEIEAARRDAFLAHDLDAIKEIDSLCPRSDLTCV